MNTPKCIGLFVLLVAGAGQAADWPLVYQTDFSTDPGWIDDDVQYRALFPTEPPLGEDHYWRQAQQDYFIRSRNWAGPTPPMPYHPNRYAYTPVPWTGESFQLVWDQRMDLTQWSGGTRFGMWDDQMNMGAPIGNDNSITVDFSRSDGGRAITLSGYAGGVSYGIWWFGYQDHVWYTCTLSYNSVADTANLGVVERDTGNPLVSLSVWIPAPFTEPLDRLGASRSGMGEQGYPGVNAHAYGEGPIDNVTLKMIPEPSLMLLTGALLLLGAVRCRSKGR